MQKLINLPPALHARLFKTNDGLCGAEIWYTYSKRFFNELSISSTLAFMPIMKKIGQKVKKFILRLLFRNIYKMIKNSGNKSLFLIFFWMILFFNAFKYYLKVSNSWIVQPQTVQKKVYAPLTSPNLAGKISFL